MSPIFSDKTKGRILYSAGNYLYKSFNGQVLYSSDGGKLWKEIYRLKGNLLINNMVYRNHLVCRLFRKEIHHFNILSDSRFGIIFDKKIALLYNGELVGERSIIGSRPLSFENIGGEFIFGEYRSNPERTEIGIYSFGSMKNLYKKGEMLGIRHIHGIYQDPYTNLVWITTGDDDDEAALYYSDLEFKKFKKILSGSQQTRAIKILFDHKYIYFGSDTPHEVNYLYRMDKSTYEVKKIVEVGSSVFHGCKVGNWMFFSTAIEPSEVNGTNFSELWASPDGINWKCIIKFKKDILSMRYFQYGQIFFPIASESNNELWFSPFATQESNISYKISIENVKILYESL